MNKQVRKRKGKGKKVKEKERKKSEWWEEKRKKRWAGRTGGKKEARVRGMGGRSRKERGILGQKGIMCKKGERHERKRNAREKEKGTKEGERHKRRRKAQKKEKGTREGERHERRRKAKRVERKRKKRNVGGKKRRKVAMTKYMDTNRITIKKTTNRQQDC